MQFLVQFNTDLHRFTALVGVTSNQHVVQDTSDDDPAIFVRDDTRKEKTCCMDKLGGTDASKATLRCPSEPKFIPITADTTKEGLVCGACPVKGKTQRPQNSSGLFSSVSL